VIRPVSHAVALLPLLVILGTACGDYLIDPNDQTIPPYVSWTDVFTQTPVEARDILWLIDNTMSMQPEGQALSPLFNDFIAAIEKYNISYQVGIITTDAQNDQGRLQGTPSIITSDTPDAAEIFQENVEAVVSSPFSKSPEEGFLSLTMALSPEALGSGGYNEGFLRDDAGLSIIVVSDDDDVSEGTVEEYRDFLVVLKGGDTSDRIMFSAIVGPEGGCTGPNGVKAAYGERYIEMTELLNGVFKSICTPNLSSVVSAVGEQQVALKSRFQLTHPAVPGTIDVFVDDVQTMEGESWTYDEAQQSVVFNADALPAHGALIKVFYQYLPEE